ncbi:hypothetical protein PQX77_009307 [Marasmius sp. AFHP31]|nr:hypothetical protein PQX77_009307 [Marasmius sp. AFHP31]
MTLFLPLEADAPLPNVPSFLQKSPEPEKQVSKAIKAILKAKRIVVICGAGISVRAGIPDFRSPEGLFQTLKRDNPREALTSGKDLFDASVFNSEQTTSLFCQMICQLSELSKSAEPTPFHKSLKALDDCGKLLRVYTQNIDAIEAKSGLTFGVPVFESKRTKTRPKEKDGGVSSSAGATPDADSTVTPPGPSSTPRCIPLHGTVQYAHCQICNHSFPLDDHLSSLNAGIPPDCPECTLLEHTRQLIGKRARGVGRLRPSVVLYNEAHKDGEGVGEMVRRDLVGTSKGKGSRGADLLLVVGTSLRVPGTKRMVREFAKAVHARGSGAPNAKEGASSHTSSNAGSPAPGKEDTDVDHPIKAIYLNLDFPVPTREWEGVFDVWLQGDAQRFGEMLREEVDQHMKAKEIAKDKKKKKAKHSEGDGSSSIIDLTSESPVKKRKGVTKPSISTGKRRKTQVEVVIPPFIPHPTPQSETKKHRPVSSAPHPHESYDPSSFVPPDSSQLVLRLPARAPNPSDLHPYPPPTTPKKPHTVTPSMSPSHKSFAVGRPPPTPEDSPLPVHRDHPQISHGYLEARRTSTSSLSSLSSLSSESGFARAPSFSSSSGDDVAYREPREDYIYSDTEDDDMEWELSSKTLECHPDSTLHSYPYQSRLQTSCIRTTQRGDGG